MVFSIEQIRTGICYPRRGLVVLKGILFNRFFGGNFGDYIMEENWDNLIILDACRFDVFKELNTLDGNLHAFHSRGSHTGEFFRRNFDGQSFLDTVYVSSNPNPSDAADCEFAHVEEVWESGWDEELKTVPPNEVVERTIKVAERFPNKRLISHFLQPHYPWIGPDGREFIAEYGYQPGNENDNVWLKLRNGEVERKRVWQVYKENLSVTLPHVQTLVENLSGKTVLTSDHGNAFGEWGVYGHPARSYIAPLVRVPWLEIPFDERKDIEATNAGEGFSDQEPSGEQLRALGYLRDA